MMPSQSESRQGGLSQLPESLARHRLLNTAETAQFLGRSVPEIRRLYRSGAMPPPVRLGSRKLGWRVGDLVDWIARRRVNEPTAA
jgi:predicted DNA-binding transcriptional regulator AlpA